jgi:hypothetical protein
MGLSDNPTCRKCGTEEKTSMYILCECKALASLRHIHQGSFLLDPEDIRVLGVGPSWTLLKGQGSYNLVQNRGPVLRPRCIGLGEWPYPNCCSVPPAVESRTRHTGWWRRRQSETPEIRLFNILGNVRSPVWGCGCPQPLDTQGKGRPHPSVCIAQCLSHSMMRGHIWTTKGPIGDHQLSAARSQSWWSKWGEAVLESAMEVQQLTHREFVWADRCLYSDGRHQLFHRRNTGPGSEAAPTGWGRPGAERGSLLGLEALSCQSASGPPARLK